LAFEALEGRQMLSSIPTTTALSASTATAVYGRPVAFTASVTANLASKPTGAVQFEIDGASYGQPVLLSGGTASIGDAALSVGSHTITAVYEPVNSALALLPFAGSTSNALKETVTADATTTAVSASANPSTVGQPATFTATVANASVPDGSTPTGAVQFNIDNTAYGKPVSLSGGTASISDAALAVGSHTITAVYQPVNSTFAGSNSTGFKETIADATTTAVSASANPSSFGQPVTVTATVANATVPTGITPTGAVQFEIDGVAYGQTVPLSGGKASISDAALAAGSHTITAIYQPVSTTPAPVSSTPVPVSSTFGGSTSSGLKETITADATTTTVSSSASPSSFGQPVTFTATVANATVPGGSTPTGSVQFKIDGAAYGSPVTLSKGTAAITDAALSAGSHTIAATFVPSTGNFSTSTTQTVTQAVNADATSTTLAVSLTGLRVGIPGGTGSGAMPSVAGASVPGLVVTLTLTATVANASAHSAGTPTGTVQFQLNGSPLGAPQTLSGGQASVTISPFSQVNPTLTVVYTPSNGNFSGSSATVSHTQFPLAVATGLAGQGTAPATIAAVLRAVSGASDSSAASILAGLGETAQQVGGAIQSVFGDSGAATGVILDQVGYSPSAIASSLVSVFNLPPNQIAGFLHNTLGLTESAVITALGAAGISFTYNANGSAQATTTVTNPDGSRTTTTQYYDANLNPTGTVTYTYNSAGQEIGYTSANGAGQLQVSDSFTYTNGKLASKSDEHFTYDARGKLAKTSTTTQTLNANGNTIGLTTVNSSFNGGSPAGSSSNTINFDGDGNVTSVTNATYDSQDREINSETDTPDGQAISATAYTYNGDSTMPSSETTTNYSYNSNGTLSQTQTDSTDFDANGNPTGSSTDVDNYDSNGNYTGSTVTTYGANGQETGSTSYGADGQPISSTGDGNTGSGDNGGDGSGDASGAGGGGGQDNGGSDANKQLD
jgi:hypothetical protein